MSLFAHSLGSILCYDLMYNTCQTQGLLHEACGVTPSAPPPPVSGPGGENETDCPPSSSLDERFAELQQLRLRAAAIEAELEAASNQKILNFKVRRPLHSLKGYQLPSLSPSLHLSLPSSLPPFFPPSFFFFWM